MTLSSRALCTVSDIETETGASSDEARMERLIETATKNIERFCGRSDGFHYEAARVDMIRGYGTPIMHSPKTPIVSIGSIVWDPDDANDTVTASLYAIDDADEGRIYRPGGWRWTAVTQEYLLRTPLPGTEQRLYQLTYACGWITAAQVGANGLFPPATVTIARVGTTATVSHTGHNLQTGHRVTISGATPSGYNDTWEITRVDDDSYTFRIGGSPTTPPTGTIIATTVRSIPADLEDACIKLVSMRYNWSPRDPDVKSEKIDSWSASWGDSGGSGIPSGIQGDITPYKRIVGV